MHGDTGEGRPGRGRSYQTNDLARTLGVSRASLRYYEQMGLVSPTRDPQTGVRSYDNQDVFDLFGYLALGNVGYTARQVAELDAGGEEFFGEQMLEDCRQRVQASIEHYEALRDSIDRMRLIRMRDRLGPRVCVEWVERYVFAEDGAECGYLELRDTEELKPLGAGVPISGFGIIFGLDDAGATTWRWGRTVPVRLAGVVGLRQHVPCQVGGCDCVTMVARTADDNVPLEPHVFDPLYRKAREAGRRPSGNPFVPYIFPPHTGTPYLVCLPLAPEE